MVLLSPTLPDLPDKTLRVVLSSSRCPIGLAISYSYISAFLKKSTCFSALMGGAFLLLGLGYLLIIQKYFVMSSSIVFDNIGDSVRICGLILLLFAVMGG